MKKAKIIVRILLGLMVLIFGLNKFLQFMPMPPLPESAGEFMGLGVRGVARIAPPQCPNYESSRFVMV